MDPDKGLIEIKGRSIPENSVEFYRSVNNWLNEYAQGDMKPTKVRFQLEYFNTSSSKCIPYNFYSLLTFVFVIALSLMKFDFGPMRGYELRAADGDLGILENAEDDAGNPRGKVIDLIFPVIVLIITCTLGMVYVGGFFGVALPTWLALRQAF